MNLKPSIIGDSGTICKAWKSKLKEKCYCRYTLIVNDFLIYIVYIPISFVRELIVKFDREQFPLWCRDHQMKRYCIFCLKLLHMRLCTKDITLLWVYPFWCYFLLKYGFFQIYFVLETILEFVVEYFSLLFPYHKTNIIRDFATLW